MRILLAGQKSFGLAAYEAIVGAGHDVVGVWSPDDLPTGQPFAKWSDKLTRRAAEDGRWVPKLERTPQTVRMLDLDLIVAAHSHDFISRPVREATRLGGVGYHPSLLPRHRGRDAVRWTVHMGDAITGGTIYWLTDNVDGGPIANQEVVFVPRYAQHDTDNATSWLWRERLFPLGVQMLVETLQDIDEGVIIEIPQDEACATWEPSWERPPLHRPDLVQIGAGISGMTHITTRVGASTHWRTTREMKEAS